MNAHPKIRKYRVALIVLTAASLLAAWITPATAQTWTGAAGDFNFSNPGNWQGGVAPVNNGTANLTFSGTGTPVDAIVDTNYSVNSITASGTSIVGIFGSQALTLMNNLKASASVSIVSTVQFILGASGVTFDVDPSRAVDVTGQISGGALVKSGTGAMRIRPTNVVNTYTGGTTINAGSITVLRDSDLGDTSGAVTFNGSGATLILDGASGTFSRNAVFNANGTIDASNGSVWNGVLSGTGNFTKAGSSSLTLTNTNTLSGTTTVSAGSLIVNGSLPNSPVNVSSGATLSGSGSFGGSVTVAGNLQGSGSYAQPVTINNLGLVTGSQNFAGAVTINSGGRISSFTGTFSGPVTVAAGGRFSASGVTTFPNGLSLAATSAIDFQLGSADLWKITGGTLTGPTTGKITLNLSGGPNYLTGIYTLFDFSGAARSNFDANSFVIGSVIPGSTTSNYLLTISGNKLQVFSTAIPEPSTWAGIAGLAMLAVAMIRRRMAPSCG